VALLWFGTSGLQFLTAHPRKSPVFIVKSSNCQEVYRDSSVVKGPSYANRTSQRVRRRNRTADVMYSSRTPRVYPLTLGPGEYTPAAPASGHSSQVFITTLERQYTAGNRLNYSNTTGCFDSNQQRLGLCLCTGTSPRRTTPRHGIVVNIAQAPVLGYVIVEQELCARL